MVRLKQAVYLSAFTALAAASHQSCSPQSSQQQSEAGSQANSFRRVTLQVGEGATSELNLNGTEALFLGVGVFQNGKEVSTLMLKPGTSELVVPTGNVEFRSSYVIYGGNDQSAANSGDPASQGKSKFVYYSKASDTMNVVSDGQQVNLDFEAFQPVPLQNIYGVAYLDDATPAKNAVLEVKDPWSGATISLPDGAQLAKTDNRGVFSFPFFYGLAGVPNEIQFNLKAGKVTKLIRMPLPKADVSGWTALPFINLAGSNLTSPLQIDLGLLKGEKGDKGDTGAVGADGLTAGIRLINDHPDTGTASGCGVGKSGVRVETWRQPVGAGMPSNPSSMPGFSFHYLCDSGSQEDGHNGSQQTFSLNNMSNTPFGPMNNSGEFGFRLKVGTMPNDFEALFRVQEVSNNRFQVETRHDLYFGNSTCATSAGQVFAPQWTAGQALERPIIMTGRGSTGIGGYFAAKNGQSPTLRSIGSRITNDRDCEQLNMPLLAVEGNNTALFGVFGPKENSGGGGGGGGFQGEMQTEESYLKSTDGGLTYTPAPNPPWQGNGVRTRNLIKLHGNRLLLQTSTNKTYLSNDLGNTWSEVSISGASVQSLFQRNKIKTATNRSYLADESGVFFSSNGSTWSPLDLSGTGASNGNFLFAVDSTGKQFVTVGNRVFSRSEGDSGPSSPLPFTAVLGPTPDSVSLGQSLSANHKLVLIPSENGKLIVSNDGGTQWREVLLTDGRRPDQAQFRVHRRTSIWRSSNALFINGMDGYFLVKNNNVESNLAALNQGWEIRHVDPSNPSPWMGDLWGLAVVETNADIIASRNDPAGPNQLRLSTNNGTSFSQPAWSAYSWAGSNRSKFATLTNAGSSTFSSSNGSNASVFGNPRVLTNFGVPKELVPCDSGFDCLVFADKINRVQDIYNAATGSETPISNTQFGEGSAVQILDFRMRGSNATVLYNASGNLKMKTSTSSPYTTWSTPGGSTTFSDTARLFARHDDSKIVLLEKLNEPAAQKYFPGDSNLNLWESLAARSPLPGNMNTYDTDLVASAANTLVMLTRLHGNLKIFSSTDGGFNWSSVTPTGLPPTSRLEYKSLGCFAGQICSLVMESSGMYAVYMANGDISTWTKVFEDSSVADWSESVRSARILNSSAPATLLIANQSQRMFEVLTGNPTAILTPRASQQPLRLGVLSADPIPLPTGVTYPIGDLKLIPSVE